MVKQIYANFKVTYDLKKEDKLFLKIEYSEELLKLLKIYTCFDEDISEDIINIGEQQFKRHKVKRVIFNAINSYSQYLFLTPFFLNGGVLNLSFGDIRQLQEVKSRFVTAIKSFLTAHYSLIQEQGEQKLNIEVKK